MAFAAGRVQTRWQVNRDFANFASKGGANLVADLARRAGMIVLIALYDLNHALRYCTNTIVIVIVIANGEMAPRRM